MGQFQPGQSGNPAGGPREPRKFTLAAKQAFQLAFEGMGGVDALTNWGIDNPTEFYRIYGRLIPVDVKVDTPPTLADQVDLGLLTREQRNALREIANALIEKRSQVVIEDQR